MGGPLRSPWVFLRGMRETVSAGLTNSLRKKRWEKNEGQKLGGVTDVFFSRVHATLQPALSVRLLVGRLVSLSVRYTFTFLFNSISLSHLKSFKSTLSHSKSF